MREIDTITDRELDEIFGEATSRGADAALDSGLAVVGSQNGLLVQSKRLENDGAVSTTPYDTSRSPNKTQVA